LRLREAGNYASKTKYRGLLCARHDAEEEHDRIAVKMELPSAKHAIAQVIADASPSAGLIAGASSSVKRRRRSSAAIPSSSPTTSCNAAVKQKAAAASRNAG
jgi:hypothetical protein